MSDIRIYSKFGEKVAEPFKVNRVYPEEDSEENTIINSSSPTEQTNEANNPDA